MTREHNYSSALKGLRSTHASGRTRPAKWRAEQLDALNRLLDEQEEAILGALKADLGKPAQESLAELSILRSQLEYFRPRFQRWMRSRKVSTPLSTQPGKSWIQPEPLGVVLIMSAWNYPVQLLLMPLVTALAAGNCVVLKPSEIAAHTAELMAELILQYLDQDAVTVIQGGVPETTALLKERFDHIVYTGSGEVGRIVMRAAAEHLTPVTLELGGKSPCVIDPGVDLNMAAKRLLWGKFLNAGQTCIAPDYLLVPEAIQHDLVEALKTELNAMYDNQAMGSEDYATIVSDKHFERLKAQLDDGNTVIGGGASARSRRIEPTVLTDVSPQASSRQEEIFGPILPIVTVGNTAEAIEHIRAGDKPLAAYLFTRSAETEQNFVDQVSAGNICINDTLMFIAAPELPFGGVGESGMGQYKGKAGFERLSHLKAVMRRGRWPEIPLRYPPYTDLKRKLFKWLS